MPVTYLGQDTVARLPFTEDLTRSDGSQRRQVLYWDDASRRGGLRGSGGMWIGAREPCTGQLPKEV